MEGAGDPDEILLDPQEAPLPRPRLRGSVVTRHAAEDLSDAVAFDLVAHAADCVREFGDFHLALSGGRTPQPLYAALMYDPRFRALPWRRTHLWIVDERCVPFDDPRSNYGQIAELIVDHSGIPRSQVHPIHAYEPDADARYEDELRETLGWREKGHDRLDCVLLGMGADGHTASIFAGSPALHDAERLAMDVPPPATAAPAVARCTLTMRTINAARFVAPVVLGADKRATH